MGKCHLTFPSVFSLWVPGPNEELFFLAASMATKKDLPPPCPPPPAFEMVEPSLYGELSWEVLFLKLSADLHQFAEETSFPQKVGFSSHNCEEDDKGEVKTGYNIGICFKHFG